MPVKRRTYLAVIGAGIGGMSWGTNVASAAETIQVTGKVVSEANASVEPGQIVIFSQESGHDRVELEDGSFEISLESGNSYDITYFHENGGYVTEFDDVPLFYGLENDRVIDQDNADLGTYELPEGYDVQIRFEDLDGNPVKDLHVGFRLPNGSGTGPQEFFTNSNGYVYASSNDESETGVELAGDVTVEVQDPKDHTNNITPMQVSISEDKEVTVPLSNPEEWGGEIVESDTDDTPTATDSPTATPSPTPTESPTPTKSPRDTPTMTPTKSPRDTPTKTDSSEQTATVTTSGGSTAQAESGNPEQRQRGFFSNSGNEPEFLSNPFNLTTLGFLLSVGGILHQMMEG